jgi:hypothetical protein
MPSAPPSTSFRPWYKEPWPWIIIGMLSAAVIAATTCVFISFHNADPVVRDDWYEDGKTINKSLDREKHAQQLGMAATITVDNTTGDVKVILKSHQPQNLPGVDIKLSHATDAARDEDVQLTRQEDGSYHGTLSKALKGHYYVDIETAYWKLSDSELFPQGTFDIVAGNTAAAVPAGSGAGAQPAEE